jgi:hypothetical protein
MNEKKNIYISQNQRFLRYKLILTL